MREPKQRTKPAGYSPHSPITGYLLAFVSGGIALIYEVLWMRQLSSFFGATALAASATLSAIFLGIAIGSAIIGSRSGRWHRPVRAYGFLEIGIGLGAVLVPTVLGLYENVYSVLYRTFLGHHVLFVGIKMVLALLALFIPTFLMGGTICVLGQAFVPSPQKLGVTGSSLYAANTLGATMGALSVPFVLLPALGARWSYLSAIAASLSVGAAACWLDLRRHRVESSRGVKLQRRSESLGDELRAGPEWMLTSMAFLSGALVLCLEVLWTSMLAQVHENSIYSYAIVLAVFLVGLAGGAFLSRLLLIRSFDPNKALGLAWIGSGLLVFASPRPFYSLTNGLSYVDEFGPFPELTTLTFAVATMLLPTLLAGMVLPLLMDSIAASSKGEAGPLLGSLLARNTAGAIVGPLIATFILLPAAGLWMSITAVGVSMILVGDLALKGLYRPTLSIVRRSAILGLIMVLIVSGNPVNLPAVKFKREGNERLVHIEEGSHGIVAVVENLHERWMLLNNFYTLGGTGSSTEERRQARIPLFLHPSPRKVAFLGVGTGITAGGALLPTVEKIVAIEIVPEVVTTARKYFANANLGVLSDPRVDAIKEDARVYLRTSGQTFDVIVGDLVVPARTGESSLFTREHFETARRALEPGGIFCQWLPMHQLSRELFQIIAATFLDVFPQTTLWRGDFLPSLPALALIGHTSQIAIDADAVDSRVQLLKPWCERTSPILSASGGIWLFLVGPLSPLDAQFAKAKRNRESEPWIELLSPKVSSRSEQAGWSQFVGESLSLFLDRVRDAPLKGSVLENLDSTRSRWRDSGAGLWQAALLLDQGHEEEANRQAARSVSSLPFELQAVISGGAKLKTTEEGAVPAPRAP